MPKSGRAVAYLKRVPSDLRKLWEEPLLLLGITLVGIFLFLFIVLPLFKIFQLSFEESGRYSLNVFVELLSKRYNVQPLIHSLNLGAAVSILGTAIGFIFAYAITRVDIPWKRFFNITATFPIIAPPFMMSLSAILLFGKQGFVSNMLLNNVIQFKIYGFYGLLVVETLTYFSTAYLTLYGVLQAIDPALEDAALDLGASKWKVFTRITLPLATPGIASAILLVFSQSLADFGNPMILAGNYTILATQAYLTIVGMYDMRSGAGLAILLLIPSLIAFGLQKYWVSRKSYVTVTGKPSSTRIKMDHPITKYSIFGLCLLLTAVIFLFYGMVLFGSVVKLWGANHTLTFDNYRHVFTVGWGFIRDTLLLSSIATPIAGLLAMFIAFLVVRKNFPGKRLMELVSLLTFAVPGTVVGIGYILAFNEYPLKLTGTAAIIVLLFIFRDLAVGVQTGIAELQQIDPCIEEAATDLGADSATTFRRITLPLITPAFYAGLAFTFVKCMTAVSAVIFVVSGKWNLITIAILGSVENSDLSQAAAFSVVIILFILLALWLIQYLVKKMQGERRIKFERAEAL
ncbi:MAG: iron ABC transporter permease [Deltaproteobacteria bacterium]|nr:iron ABC transporter permease [Deltaproteobacteria bacterium]